MEDPADTTSGSAGTTWVYEYDRGGNITAKMRYAYTTGTVGALLQTIPYIYNATWKDKLAAYNGQTITSDAIGNTLNDGTWTYYWEMGRRLWQMEKGNYGAPNSVLMNFNYNAEGVRIGKLCDSHDASGNNSYVYTDYYVHGKKIMHMTQSGNNLHFFYDAQGRPAVVNYNGTKYAYILNLQGDVLGLRNSSGTEVVKYTYDAWGKILSTTGSMASSLGKLNPFRYRGYVYDEETGLYYLQSRYYNPEWGRFINADTLLRVGALFGNNHFSYCRNRPVSRNNHNGTFDFTALYEAIVSEINQLNSAEKSLLNIYTLAQVSVVFLGKAMAKYWTNTLFKDSVVEGNTLTPSNADGTLANAFKHAYWNAYMSYHIGEKAAYDFATAHEYETQLLGDKPYLKATEKAHSDMDLYYNELGRQTGLRCKKMGIDSENLAYCVLWDVIYDQSAIIITDYGNQVVLD